MSAINFSDYVELDATALAAGIQAKDFTPLELLETAIERAEAVNPKINAIAEKLYDHGRAAATGPLPDGPFAGVPWAVKDLAAHVAGTPMRSGSRAFKDFVSSYDSELVARFKKAGMVIFAKSTTPEFGITTSTESLLHGNTANPWDLTRTSGGSSGGASAMVAAGILPAAHATDGGGSIRIPAASCGLFGLKPSRGRVPMGPDRTEGWNGLSTGLAVTRSVRDMGAILDAVHGVEPGSRYSAPPPATTFLDAVSRAPGKLRIALQLTPASGSPVDPECIAAARDAAALCESLGHHVEEAAPSLDIKRIAAGATVVIAVAIARTFDMRAAALGRGVQDDDMEPVTRFYYDAGKTATGVQIADADEAFMVGAVALARFMERYDVMLSPTIAQPPLKLGMMSLNQPVADYGRNVGGYAAFCGIANQTGVPSMSVPLGWSSTGLPIGIMFTGRYGAEDLLLSLAGQLEQASPWFGKRAPL